MARRKGEFLKEGFSEKKGAERNPIDYYNNTNREELILFRHRGNKRKEERIHKERETLFGGGDLFNGTSTACLGGEWRREFPLTVKLDR